VDAQRCDNGNTAPSDGCDATCQTEKGFECIGGNAGQSNTCRCKVWTKTQDGAMVIAANTTVQSLDQRSVQQYLTAVDTVVQQSQARLRVGQKIPAGPETSNRKEAGSATLANSRRATTRVKASAAATAIISGQTATRWSCLTRAETRSSSRTSHKRESVLFIGTQFSILYTSMYSPAEAATPRA
jgi:cysteine-rich repeat protein